jgi:hypothetical protein
VGGGRVIAIASAGGGIEAAMAGMVAGAVIVILLGVQWYLTRTMREMRSAADDLHRETLGLLADLRGAVGHANAELDRVDGLLGTAESISATVDSASRLAYVTVANPVVKILAFGHGTARAARRLRRSPAPAPAPAPARSRPSKPSTSSK